MSFRPTPNKKLPTIYISGPMSGYEDYNYPAFNEFSRKLRNLGFPVLNPADFGVTTEDWKQCLIRDIGVVSHAQVVILLPGWRESKGAQLESDVAYGLGLLVVEPDEFQVFIESFFDKAELERACEEDEIRQNAPIILIRRAADERCRKARIATAYARLAKDLGFGFDTVDLFAPIVQQERAA